jgi:hypothetical protein
MKTPRRYKGPALTLFAVLAVGVAVLGVNTVLAKPTAHPAVTREAQSAPAADPYAASDGYGAAPQASPETAVPQAAAPQNTGPQHPAPQNPAPQNPAPQATRSAVTGAFAGRSAGNEVTLAVGMDGDRVVAYVCDGNTIESWYQGTENGGNLQLTGTDGELTATTTDKAVLGTVTVGDKSWPFAAQLRKTAGAPTDRGILTKLGSA